jgi:dihydrofolate synthase / folylpolyglutamate synthase
MSKSGQPPPTADSRPQTLGQWLDYIEHLHPQAIAMGLERVAATRHVLSLSPSFPVITVGGTNGKGSASAILEAILSAAGYRVGCYTSPHLLRYNERIRIDRSEASDADLASAFTAVETARGTTRLTYFEFGTLAAVLLFVRHRVDIAVLEVGLGGRLDAVNAFDPDCAVVTSIALDHMDFLGATREQIAYEKAGIFRGGRPAICADSDPPESLRRHAAAIGARLLLIGADFGFVADKGHWQYWGPGGRKTGLPHPALRGAYQLANASAALAALDTLRDRLPVGMNDIRAGLLHAECPGRFQVLPGRPVVILDVAHNPQAAAALAENLTRSGPFRRTIAVFAMLGDKDIGGVARELKAHIDQWFIAGTGGPRGADAGRLVEALRAAAVTVPVATCSSIADAYAQACDLATENDRILVFGSFYTVAAVMQARTQRGTSSVS